jgi:hypothetical protein
MNSESSSEEQQINDKEIIDEFDDVSLMLGKYFNIK